jgi:hypothetical protein
MDIFLQAHKQGVVYPLALKSVMARLVKSEIKETVQLETVAKDVRHWHFSDVALSLGDVRS